MKKPIHLRITVCPKNEHDPADSFHCDIEFDEADIQHLDERHGFDDFMEKFVKPGLWTVLDRFQEPYTDIDDFIKKTANGANPLPRSIDFYREKIEMMKRGSKQ